MIMASSTSKSYYILDINDFSLCHSRHQSFNRLFLKTPLLTLPSWSYRGNIKEFAKNMTYMLFTGREVRIGKSCARGLEYGQRPQAEGRTRDRGHSFSQYGPTKAGKYR